MKRLLVHILVLVAYMVAYITLSTLALNFVFYDVLNIQRTFVSSMVVIGIVLAFWFFFLRARLFGPGGPFGTK